MAETSSDDPKPAEEKPATDGNAGTIDLGDADLTDDWVPPKRRRHPLLAISVIILAAVLGFLTRHELLYFFAPRTILQLGEAAEVFASGKPAPTGRYVSFNGLPDRRSAVKLDARFGRGYYSFFRLTGSNGAETRVFVQRKKADGDSPLEWTDSFIGRLRYFSEVPHFDSVSKFYAAKLRSPIEVEPADMRKAVANNGTSIKEKGSAKQAPLRPDTDLWMSVTFPGDLVIRIHKRKVPKRIDAARLVAALGVRWTTEGKDNPKAMSHEFVVQVPEQSGDALGARIEELKGKLSEVQAVVIARTGTYLTQFGALKADGENVSIAPDRSHPTRYVPGTPGQKAQPAGADGGAAAAGGSADAGAAPASDLPVPSLVAAPADARSIVPWARVASSELSVPMEVPKDALLLVEGEQPGSQWHILALHVLLLAFVIFNTRSLVLRFREGSEDQSADEAKPAKA